MISGYNTDVPHEDVVYHVQTEDKGTGTAWIESLVYVGGAILARRRSSYKKVLERGGGEEAIVRIMDRQHRKVIAEIRGGKFDKGSAGDDEPEAESRESSAEASTAEADSPQDTARQAVEEQDYSDLSLDQAILQFDTVLHPELFRIEANQDGEVVTGGRAYGPDQFEQEAGAVFP